MDHYVCSLCDLSFRELSVLHLHMGVHIKLIDPSDNSAVELPGVEGEKFQEVSFKCEVCHESFLNIESFAHHKRTQCKGKSFLCNICGCVFSTKSRAYNHVCRHISEELCNCTRGHLALQEETDQPGIFKSADDLNLCDVCGRGYNSRRALRKHINCQHVSNIACSICKESFESQVECDNHMECHSYIRCKICFQAFVDNKSRDEHMKIHCNPYHGDMAVTGQDSISEPPVVKDRKYINDHSTSEEGFPKKIKSEHIPERNDDLISVNSIEPAYDNIGPSVSVDQIPKKTGLRSILKVIGVTRGRVAGTSEKGSGNSGGGNMVNANTALYTGFKNKGYSVVGGIVDKGEGNKIWCLNSSTREESGMYKCKLCLCVVNTKHTFWQHLLQHPEEVPYTCKICVEIFDDDKSFEFHMTQKCNCAGCRKLLNRSRYSVHTKICPGSNPFKCRVCVERFPSLEVLKRHMESHTREESCRCKVCGEILLYKNEAERHKKMHEKESLDSSTLLLNGYRDEVSHVTVKSENLLFEIKSDYPVKDSSCEEKDVKMALPLTKVETDIDSYAVDPHSSVVVKMEPLEDQFFNDTVVANVVDDYSESAVDPLA